VTKLIGIIGATGTGKTTLCEKSGFPFIKTDVSGVYKTFGLDPKMPMSLTTRLMVQREILRRHEVMWHDQRLKFSKAPIIVTDRTPICFMTYMLAEISGYGKLSEQETKEVEQYLTACRHALHFGFGGIMQLTGRPFAVDEGDGKIRATRNPAYHEHYQALSIGLTVDNLPKTRYHIETETFLEGRLTSLKNFAGSL
jgi:hypothetical protein